jgi:transcriptional regulator of acetoin/glycerol metabolism
MEPADDTITDAHELRRPAKSDVLCASHLMLVLECARPWAGVARHSLANVDGVLLGRCSERRAARTFDGQRTLVLGVPDGRMSGRHARIRRQGSSFVLEDLGSRNGTRISGVPVREATVLADGDLIELGHTIFRYRASLAVPLGESADEDSCGAGAAGLLPTIVPTLARRVRALGSVARSALPILLLGETGTGKEVLAKGIHRASGRAGEFVAVNCGALPPALVESQLFGHVRGAFSGAVSDARGVFRSADGGTVFLDEIGDLPADSQAALLRVLQEREVVPVGGSRPIKVDYRLIAATHQPLHAMATEGRFRSDLLARLAGFSFELPPSRERADDVGLWIASWLGERRLSFTMAAGRALVEHGWPLNIREVVHALEAAAVLAGGGPVDVHHLPVGVSAQPVRDALGDRRAAPPDATRERLLVALSLHRGNVSAVARDLGKARMQVQRWMRRWGIDGASFRR